MTPAAATVLGAIVGGSVAIIVALINSFFGRSGQRADITSKITQANATLLTRMDQDKAELSAKCEKCETKLEAQTAAFEAYKVESKTELKRLYRVLRTLVLALDRHDAAGVERATAEAWDLING